MIARWLTPYSAVQLTHEEYDTNLTLATYAKGSVHRIIFDYEDVQS